MRRENDLALRAEALVRQSDALRGELRACLAEIGEETRPLLDALRVAGRYAWLAEVLFRLAGRIRRAGRERARRPVEGRSKEFSAPGRQATGRPKSEREATGRF